jgi:DNA polymerase-3 subunit epsilon
MSVPIEYEALAQALDASPDHRVLRRLRPHDDDFPIRGDLGAGQEPDIRLAAVVDVETTGTDPTKDKIIELGVAVFCYDEYGQVAKISQAGSWLEDPGQPIDPKITELTGITDADVAGQRIPDDVIAVLVDGCGLIIAHHAGFDRPFCETRFPWASEKHWACSMSEIDWRAAGAPSSSLQAIAWHMGFFFDGHRAEIDCRALVEILSKPSHLPFSEVEETVLAALLASARKPTYRLWAVGSPFETKDALKARGYRWHDGATGPAKCWWRDVAEGDVDAEQAWLRTDILSGRDPRVERLTAVNRYSRNSNP